MQDQSADLILIGAAFAELRKRNAVLFRIKIDFYHGEVAR